MRRLAILLAVVPISCALFQKGAGTTSTKDLQRFEETREVMRRKVVIKLLAKDAEQAKAAMDAAFGEIDTVDKLVSEWSPESDITRLNQAAGKEPVPISVEASHILQRGLEVSEVSDGAFSLTWAALAPLWDFAPSGEGRTVPTAEQIKERLPLVDDSQLVLDPSTKTAFLKKEGMSVGVGGVSKGYALYRALRALEKAGVNNAYVSIGGDIGAMGDDKDGEWEIGIPDPRGEDNFARLSLYEESVVTSGDYKHFFDKDGVRYHSIVDPRTGMPARGCRSVTVLAEDGVTADALATAVFVLGPTDGMALVEKSDGVESVIVSADNEVLISSGLEGSVNILHPPTP